MVSMMAVLDSMLYTTFLVFIFIPHEICQLCPSQCKYVLPSLRCTLRPRSITWYFPEFRLVSNQSCLNFFWLACLPYGISSYCFAWDLPIVLCLGRPASFMTFFPNMTTFLSLAIHSILELPSCHFHLLGAMLRVVFFCRLPPGVFCDRYARYSAVCASCRIPISVFVSAGSPVWGSVRCTHVFYPALCTILCYAHSLFACRVEARLLKPEVRRRLSVGSLVTYSVGDGRTTIRNWWRYSPIIDWDCRSPLTTTEWVTPALPCPLFFGLGK